MSTNTKDARNLFLFYCPIVKKWTSGPLCVGGHETAHFAIIFKHLHWSLTTGCPEVPYNFDTPLFSGMAWDLRLIFGVFKVQMKTFFYIYKTWGWIAIWLRKYLGKLEHVLKFSILTPSKIACQMRQNQCIKVSNDINLPKKKRMIVEFNLTTSLVGVLLVPNSK